MNTHSSIFVAVYNYGAEGYSKPLQAFSSRRYAEMFLAGAKAGQGGRIEIVELPVDKVDPLPQATQ